MKDAIGVLGKDDAQILHALQERREVGLLAWKRVWYVKGA
jgi:hypothetical protein